VPGRQISPAQDGWPASSASRYFGSNLSQLTTVRQKYDPNRIMFSGPNF
jgi:hypothetical protein